MKMHVTAEAEHTIIDSGVVGNSVQWRLCEEGTLTFSGTGDIPSYEMASHVPWYMKRKIIKKIVVEEGVNSIGTYAFSGMEEATEVILPHKMQAIYEGAFINAIV